MQLCGADIIMECLMEQGVDTVFGYPGGQVITIYDALYKYEGKINHILTAHEQGAAHAADGYARSTGKTGVCIATSGPGATNLVTGIATAFMDSVPMVAITGNVPTSLLGKDSFQEIDIFGVTTPITKHNFIVKKVEDLAPTLREAFRIAGEGRKGPVLVDILKDITVHQTEFSPVKPRAAVSPVSQVSDRDIETAVSMITSAKQPMIFAGGGIISSGASDELYAFSRLVDAPVALSLMALGAYPADAPELTGMIGMHGTRASALACMESDLLIAVGTRFSDRVISKVSEFAPHADILHIDIDAAEINKNVQVKMGLVGDAKQILQRIIAALPQQSHPEWMRAIEKNKRAYPLPKGKQGELSPQYVLQTLTEVLGSKDAYIATDVGQHQMWTAQYYPISKPRHFITSGGLGTMGFGMGAAIGAKASHPDKPVVLVTGDGSFHMNMNELVTAGMYHLPIVILIMDNKVLGMVHQWQKMMFGKRYSQTTLNRVTDYVKLAEAFGCIGYKLDKSEDVCDVLTKALNADVPVVIDCLIDPEENVLPLVPPGKAIEQQILAFDEEAEK